MRLQHYRKIYEIIYITASRKAPGPDGEWDKRGISTFENVLNILLGVRKEALSFSYYEAYITESLKADKDLIHCRLRLVSLLSAVAKFLTDVLQED